MRRLEAGLVWAMLAVSLVLPSFLGFLTTYFLALLALLALIVLAATARSAPIEFGLPAKVFATAFFILAGLFALTARRPDDLLDALNFTAFLAYLPIAGLYARKASKANAPRVAVLALAGASLSLGFAFYSNAVMGVDRAVAWNLDPIRLGDTALLLGFLALIGIPDRPRAVHLVFLFGPLAGLMTVILAGARGGLVTFPVLLVVAIVVFVPARFRLAGIGGIALSGAAAAALAVGLGQTDRILSIGHIASALLDGGTIGDAATRIRFDLYHAGLAAFRESPLIGHGWANIMQVTRDHLPEALKTEAGLPHLHNDILEFAVGGGVLGVAVYVAVLVLPVVAAISSARDSQRRRRILGGTVLTVGYFVMGLPDVMVGFELHTALLVALTAALIGFCRDAPPGTRPSADSANDMAMSAVDGRAARP